MDWPEPIEKIVLYSGADFDALFATWLFMRNISFAKYAKIEFVKIGETWKNQKVDSDPSIVHIDTGSGRFDHHRGKAKTATSLIAKELELENDPALKNLMSLVESYERAEKQPFYAPSQLITGWYYKYNRNPKVVVDRAFELFDVLYGQEQKRVEAESRSNEVAWKECGQYKVAVLNEIPQLRDWAFEAGAAIVVWKNTVGGSPNYGIQVSRSFDNISLVKAVAALRSEEAKVRSLNLEGNLEAVDELKEMPGWYLHHSYKLILCGSRKKPLKKNEVSLLSFEKILNTVCPSI